MEELKLLIVEDDPAVVETYKRGIKAFNLGSEIRIIPDFSKDKDTAMFRLSDNQSVYDAAIVDLDLTGSTGVDRSGNEVIRLIKENLRFPIFVISGTPHNLDEDLKEETSLFKVRTRGDEGDFLEEIVSIYKTGITNILKRTGTIEGYITKIFWNHLSTSLDLWINDEIRSQEEKEKSLLRYTLLHIQEYLELTADSDFENYHPAEIYITPPIKDKVFTGDILLNLETNERFIVLTPSCDLAQTKAKDILIAEIEKGDTGILAEKIGIIKKARARQEVIEESKQILESLIENNFSNKYHFLPKYKNINAGLVNFQKAYSFRTKDFNGKFERVATVNSSFTKDIIARFSYYYSRQGSPDFNTEEVYNSLIK